MSTYVRPKKFLGQHFLTDDQIASRIVSSMHYEKGGSVLEIGPGKGVLTSFLFQHPLDFWLVEIDRESIAYLKNKYTTESYRLLEGDCLQMDWGKIGTGALKIIGNFPYHISTQLLFKVLTHRTHVQEVVCMLQKEVAERMASGSGNRTYGIPSVLIQTWYDVELLFSVPPEAFLPPPKVTSAVIRMTRNTREKLPFDELEYSKVVKQAFQNRRKTLRNALKPLNLPNTLTTLPVFDKRAEQLSVEQFIELTSLILKTRESPDTL